MKRGPKSACHRRLRRKLKSKRKFPDEEGTKVFALRLGEVELHGCKRKFPDEEGTKAGSHGHCSCDRGLSFNDKPTINSNDERAVAEFQ